MRGPRRSHPKPPLRVLPSGNKLAWLLLALLVGYLLLVHLPKMREIPFLWFERPSPPDLYLTSYDTDVSAGSPVNFSGHVNLRLPPDQTASCTLCGRPAFILGEGEFQVSMNPAQCAGYVNLTCGQLSVGFPYTVAPALPPEFVHFERFTARADGRWAVLELRGNGLTHGTQPLRLFVDGREVAAPSHALRGEFSLEERIPLAPGEHVIEVRLLDVTATTRVSVTRPYPWSSLVALALSLALALLIGRGAGARLALFLASLLGSLAFEFQLSALGLPALASLALLALLLFAHRRKLTWRLEPSLARDALLFGLLWASLTTLVGAWLGPVDLWGPFYYRHAEETLARGTPVYFDDLSYLGRWSTYPPAFFDFAASLAGLGNATGFESVRLPIHWLLAFAFAFGMHLLFSRLPRAHRWVASSLFFSVWFLFMVSTVHSLHVYAYALLALGVVLFEFAPGALRWAAALPLAAGFAAHPTVLFFFPVFAWVARGFSWDLPWVKRGLLTGALAVLLSLPFYLPVFLRSGLPYEIVPRQWGYLLTYGLDGVRFDFHLGLPLLALAILLGLRSTRWRLPALAALALLLVDVFVTFRVNLLLALVGAALVPLVLLGEERRTTPALAGVLLLAALGTLALGLVAHGGTTDYCQWGLANEECLGPVHYLASHASYSDAVAVPPLWGHLTAWLAYRRVLADLYVEYADERKFRAVDSFYSTGDVSPLRPFGVSLAVMDKTQWPPREASDGRVLGAQVRLYDNGFSSIHRVT